MTDEQRKTIDSGARYFNVEEYVCKPYTQGSTSSNPISGSNNQEIAYKFFVGKGLTPEQAAGIVGNLMQESTESIDPLAVNSTGHKGIAQWDSGRYAALEDWATINSKDPAQLLTQLEYIWEEMNTSEQATLTKLRTAATAKDAALFFEETYERSGGDGNANRIKYAEDTLALYGGATGGTGGTSGSGGSGTIELGAPGVNGGNYNPDARFPYGNGPRLSTSLPAGANITLEDYAKLLLKFIAVGAGKSETDVVTDQKVMAVVAMLAKEGGSSANKAAYNGLNVAKDGIFSDLDPIYNHVYGDGNKHPAFRHIEQGVESNARFIEKDHYSRIWDLLTDPTTTTKKFVDNVDNLSYNGATGQLNWAAGGYGSGLQQILNDMENIPGRKEKWYNTPILGSDAIEGLASAGVTGSTETTPLNINATTTNFSSSGGGCITSDNQTGGSGGGSLPSGSAQELAAQILSNPNITPDASAQTQLENISNGNGPCPSVNGGQYTIKDELLQVISALGRNNKFTIASLHRGCTGSTVGAGSKSRHWAGAAVDISGSRGINGVTMPSFAAYDEVIQKFVHEVVGLFPTGSYGIGVPNNTYINNTQSHMKEGNSLFLDTPGTTGATGPHIHIQVPR